MPRLIRPIITALLLLAIALPGTALARSANRTVILATTTSTQDSGLLDVLVPMFEKMSGYTVKTVAVGSGQALKMGEKGEADVLLVHSPEAEKKFMAAGFGFNRRLVMHNDFVIIGPASDPAGVRTVKGAAAALQSIAARKALFISRGDNSGTHAREKALWQAAGINPEGKSWYQQTGLGMGQSLQVAAEKKAYILTDRATFLTMQKNLNLQLLSEKDKALLNVYHVIEPSPYGHPRLNIAGGRAFANFLIATPAQDKIGSFGSDKFDAPLFTPDAGRNPADLGL